MSIKKNILLSKVCLGVEIRKANFALIDISANRMNKNLYIIVIILENQM